AKSVIDAEGAARRIQLQQIETICRTVARSHHEPLCFRIPCCPVRAIDIAQLESRDYRGLGRIGNVENDQALDRRDALHQIVSDDGRYAAPVAGKSMDELRARRRRLHRGDALDAAAEALHEDRPVRTEPRLLRANLRIVIRTDVQVRRLEQLE